MEVERKNDPDYEALEIHDLLAGLAGSARIVSKLGADESCRIGLKTEDVAGMMHIFGSQLEEIRLRVLHLPDMTRAAVQGRKTKDFSTVK
jgi:hypothetical protein